MSRVPENRIKQLRESVGLKQHGLAVICHVGQSAISAWETGQNSPRVEQLVILCDYFKKSAGYILGIEDDYGYPIREFDKDVVRLAPSEKKLIQRFRELDEDDQEAVLYRALELKKQKEQRKNDGPTTNYQSRTG